MRIPTPLFFAVALIHVSLLLDASVAAEDATLPEAADRAIDYARHIEPILRRSCYSCHGAETQESGLRLDVQKRALEGGDGGVVIVPGKAPESRLIHVVAGTDEYYGIMPPEGEGTPLTSEEVALLRDWIDRGAVWPDASTGETARSDHWSLQPITRPAVPRVQMPDGVRNPIDAFVLARLQQEGIEPSPEAPPETLLRRVYLDLIGLPPSPADLQAFLKDTGDGAYERWVDRLLESQHYGERWGRHWLDLARYADSDGYEKDLARPFAWRYRQWVIDALNADMPYDRFSIEQIAGDLLPEAGLPQKTATGFHRNTLHNTEGGADPEEDRVNKTVDRTNTLGTIWLGLTIDCAQCHTHKYDPITQREYFSMYGFFNSIDEADIAVPLPDEQRAEKAEQAKVRAVTEASTPRETRVHVRGDFLSPGDVVQVGIPSVLPPVQVRGEHPNRLDLARWLFAPENPLTARVTVNRIWQRYFGRGIVATVDDFGAQGDPPSHPELLDWLACEFRDGGWRIKDLHRTIVTSATYRQTSAARPDLEQIDPENVLLARQTRRRVEAEIVRDLALAASGLLDPRIGGPSVRPPQPAEYSQLTYANSARWETSKGGDRYRRGLYTFFQRTSPYPMLTTFDAPDSTLCTAQRSGSNTPLQALTLWNDAVFFECSQSLGRRIVGEAPAGQIAEDTAMRRADYAFVLCLSRQPAADEQAALLTFYRAQRELCERDEAAATAIVGSSPVPNDVPRAELAAWIMVGRVLLNLDEFVTKE